MQTSDLIPSPNTSILDMALQVAVIQVHLLHPVTQCLLMASLLPVMAITTVLLHHHRTDITEVRHHRLPTSTTLTGSHRPPTGITEVHHHPPAAIIHLDHLLVAIRVLVMVRIGSFKVGINRHSGQPSGFNVYNIASFCAGDVFS